MRMTRVAAPLGLCVLLAGCFFSSTEPLFPDARSRCPYPAAPTAFVEDPSAGEKSSEPTRISIAADGAVCVITDTADGSVIRAAFVPIGRNRWIAQMPEKDSVSYLIAERSGDRLTYWAPQCEDFSDRRLRQTGVETEDEAGRTICRATDARGLERLFRSWSRSGHGPAVRFHREES